jgi:hypothetical protein
MPLYMAPEMYDLADYTAEADVYSFSLIVYEVFVGKPVFPATLSLAALMKKVVEGARPGLPDSMDATVSDIIRRGWSVEPGTRGSFEDILEALRRIRFGMTAAIDEGKVSEFVALVEPSAATKSTKQLLPLMRKGKLRLPGGRETGTMYDIPEGIIAHLTKKCDGNVQDQHAVDVTSGSFTKETAGANPHSGAYDNRPSNAAKNVADLEAGSIFHSAYRRKEEDIQHTRNNWLCYDFKKTRIVPTHYTIRTNGVSVGGAHLKSWLVETSVDGKSWQEVAREEDNTQFTSGYFTVTFAVACGEECRFIRLVNIGRNHFGDDQLNVSAWEIFGALVE